MVNAPVLKPNRGLVVHDHLHSQNSTTISSIQRFDEPANTSRIRTDVVRGHNDVYDSRPPPAMDERVVHNRPDSQVDLNFIDSEVQGLLASSSSSSSLSESNSSHNEDENAIKLITVDETLSETYLKNNDGKAIVGILIHASHTNNRKDQVFLKGSSKKEATIQNDRTFLFGDVKSPNWQVFIIITQSPKQARRLFGSLDKSIGDTFIVFEPVCKNTMGENGELPIIDTHHQIQPFEMDYSNLYTNPQVLSSMSCSMKYEVIKGATIDIKNLLVVESSCGGTLCDRQLPQETKHKCVCFQMSHKNSVTIVCNVWVNGTTLVEDHRSLRTTKMFIDLPETAQYEHYQPYTIEIRKKVNKIIKHINRYGGFTIVLWRKRGTVTDAAHAADYYRTSKDGPEKIASDQVIQTTYPTCNHPISQFATSPP
eukprot:scaffold30234_cov41-Attheya_sp.AAC.3